MSDPTREDPPEPNPQKELLAEAAEAIRLDEKAREERRPKNVRQGTVGLVGDSLGGVALGAAAVVMGPVQGYKQSGPKGIIGGTLGGLAMGVASAAVGVGSGIGKFAHGTSRSLSGLQSSGLPAKLVVKENEDPGAYREEKKLLYGELFSEFQSANPGGVGAMQPPVENELYEVLGVPVDANPGQIRKAYYKLAQRYHPDKHPDDKDATAKFQKISEAYQVLSDPVKREEYHRLGASVANGETMMDPKALFALMFSDFEHIVGDLATSTILSSMGSADETEQTKEALEARAKKKAEFQKAREVLLVKLLNRRLEPWLRGDEVAFIEHAKHEVAALRKEPFGKDLLHTTAYVYRKRASKMLESKGPLSGVSTFLDDLSEKVHSLKRQMRALEGGVKAISEQAKTAENESIDEAARREAVSTLGAVWLASVIDIEKTLKHVVSTILYMDEKEKAPDVVSKAEALLVLAQIFQQA